MSEKKKKTTLEEKIKTFLSGETQKNALDFAAFLKANEIPPKLHVITIVGDGGDFPHIRPWTIFFNVCDFDTEEGSANDDLAEFAWRHAHICDHFITDGKRCGCGRQPGSKKIIFGKEFENICHCPMQFIDPDAKTLQNMKKLLLMLKYERK